MEDDEAILLRMLLAERDAAQLVAHLVNQGFTVDEAFALVRFPFDD